MVDPESMIPRMAGAIDEARLRALPLAAVDRFVLSLIDGQTTAKDLAQVVGIETEEVLASLLKLEAMRVIVLPSSKVPADRASGPLSVPPAPSQGAEPDADAEVVDLDPEHRRQIDDLYGALGTLDHYTVLGVPVTADRKTIKRGYFERTARYHPDRFFRKRLGSYKLKMESVFGRMTEAHDVLTSTERRAEYDAYLGSVAKTRSLEEMLSTALTEAKRAGRTSEPPSVPPSGAAPPPSSPPVSVVRIPEPPPSSLRPADATRAPPPPPATTPRAPFDPPSSPNLGPILSERSDPRPATSSSAGRISIFPPNEPPTSRREILARRLTGNNLSQGRPAPAPAPAPAAPAPAAGFAKSGDAVDALKRRYEEKKTLAKSAQLKKYMDAANEARAKGDKVATANALRVALELDPESPELQNAHREAQNAADALLVDQYLKQAEYEEKAERWAEAGRSWTRVTRTRTTDGKAHERAAFCILKASGDLHDAASLGQRAVQLDPKNADFRRTLASIYLAANMTLNAKRELEVAVQLAPNDAQTAAVLKRISKST